MSKNLSERQMSRRRLLELGVASSTVAAATVLEASTALAASTVFAAHPKWKFVFVNHVTTNAFFVPTQYGAADACDLLGCTYQWTGSETSQVSEMINAMNTAVAAKADGIAVAVIDPKAFNKPVADALQAGVPVVAYNSDAPASSNNQRMAYIGQDLFQAGVLMGQRIISLVPKGSKIALGIDTPGSLNLQPRIDGIESAIKTAGNPLTYDVITLGSESTQELDRWESYYLGHKDVKGMFSTGGSDTQAVGQIMKKYDLAKKGVVAGGFDLLPLTLQLIDQGYLNWTIDQQPYQQGFWPVMQLFLYKLSGGLQSPSDTNTGLKFITKETVKPYLSTTSRFEGSSKEQKNLSSGS